MSNPKGRGYAGEKSERGEAGLEKVLRLLSSTLSSLAAQGPVERHYKAAVECAARAIGGSLSLWRYGDEDPRLVVYVAAEGSSNDRELLGSMEQAAAEAMEHMAADSSEGPNGKEAAGVSEGPFVVSLVRSSTGLWGALVHLAGEKGEAAGAFMECFSAALMVAVEREILHDEVASLRGRIAASERDREPSERYAAIGQLATHCYRELDAILSAAGVELQRGERSGKLPESGECLSELLRARDILSEQLDLARLEMPILQLEDLNALLQKSLREMGDKIHSKGLRLMKRLSPDLPQLLLDQDKIKVAVHKVLGAAVARSVPEGWLRVETAGQGDDVRFQVTWEEKGAPGEANEDMFLPFGSLDRGGMGLIVASQIIREHGGGVRVKRYESGSIALILDFPIQINQDRRRRRSRRSGLDRRRPTER